MQTAGEVCNRTVVVVSQQDPVLKAARVMRHFHVGCVLVVEEGEDGVQRPVGIVTDRDITVGVVATMPERLQQLAVGDILYAPLVTLPAHADLLEVIHTMRMYGVRQIPVVDSRGGHLGIITFDDVIALVTDEMRELTEVVQQEFERERAERTPPPVHPPRDGREWLWGPLV